MTPPPTVQPTPPPAPAVRIELVHDLVCPWCRIGHANLKQALQGFPARVEVHYRPFLLEPDVPPEGADLRQRLGAKYGPHRVEAMFQRVTEAGARAGVRFDFAKVRKAPDTSLGHTLLAAAPADRQEALLETMHVAYFEQGLDIGDPQVLAQAWAQVGLPAAQAAEVLADSLARDRTRQEAAQASRQGIGGVPHFTFQGPQGVPQSVGGAQPPEVLRQVVERVAGR